jgi:hypothetical protein
VKQNAQEGGLFGGELGAARDEPCELRKRGLDSQDAEDLLQEAFLTLHSHILDHGFPDSIRRMLLAKLA